MSNNKDSLGDRMKGYENTTRFQVLRRTPVIIRVDGRAFHTFTRCLKHHDDSLKISPFSEKMHQVMMGTAAGLTMEMQNAVFAYTQSDEISVLLRDWDRHETEQWFDGVIPKMLSISAAASSVVFNYFFDKLVRVADHYTELAQFDARVFNIPKEEVTNYFIWRQQDASRNSVQMLGRFHFSQKQMHGKNVSQVQDMLMNEKGINWNDIATWMKRGSACYRNPDRLSSVTAIVMDDNIPIFTQDRNFVEHHLEAEKDEQSKTTTNTAGN